jgi:hypothetical protein
MVNINDINEVEPEEALEEQDRLKMIFERQTELINKYKDVERQNLPHVVPDNWPVNLETHLGQDQVRQRIFWCMIELSEASDCMKNKAWKRTMIETDVPHLHEEMVDALHFFVEACLLMGMGPEQLFQLYMQKSRVNKFRIRSNY